MIEKEKSPVIKKEESEVSRRCFRCTWDKHIRELMEFLSEFSVSYSLVKFFKPPNNSHFHSLFMFYIFTILCQQ